MENIFKYKHINSDTCVLSAWVNTLLTNFSVLCENGHSSLGGLELVIFDQKEYLHKRLQ